MNRIRTEILAEYMNHLRQMQDIELDMQCSEKELDDAADFMHMTQQYKFHQDSCIWLEEKYTWILEVIAILDT